jgi:hypothetical protein
MMHNYSHLQLWVKKSYLIVFKAIITQLFSRKPHNENWRMAGLLTYSLLSAFPTSG